MKSTQAAVPAPTLWVSLGAPRGRLRAAVARAAPEAVATAAPGQSFEILHLDHFLKPPPELPRAPDGYSEGDLSHEDAVDWHAVLAEASRPRESATILLISDDRAAGCTSLLSSAERLVFFSASEARSFRNAVLCRVNVQHYERSLWPNHARRAAQLVQQSIADQKIAKRLAIFDEDAAGDEPEASRVLAAVHWFVLHKGAAAQARERQKALARVEGISAQPRTVRQLQQVRRELTAVFEAEAFSFADRLLLALDGPWADAVEALWQLWAKLVSSDTMVQEERARWTSVLCSRDVGGKVVSVEVIRWACSCLKGLTAPYEQVCPSPSDLLEQGWWSTGTEVTETLMGMVREASVAEVVLAMQSVLFFGRLHFLRHRMWDSCLEETIELCHRLLAHSHWILQSLGTRLMAQLVEADGPRYAASMARYATRHGGATFAELAANALLTMLGPLTPLLEESTQRFGDGQEVEALWHGHWYPAEVVWHFRGLEQVSIRWTASQGDDTESWLSTSHVRLPSSTCGLDYIDRLKSLDVVDWSCLRRLLDRSLHHTGHLEHTHIVGLMRAHRELVQCGAPREAAEIAGALLHVLRLGESRLTTCIMKDKFLLDDLAATVRDLADRGSSSMLGVTSTLLTELAWFWARRRENPADVESQSCWNGSSWIAPRQKDVAMQRSEAQSEASRTSPKLPAGRLLQVALADPGEQLANLLEVRASLKEESARCAALEARARAAEEALQERDARIGTLLQEREVLQQSCAEMAIDNGALHRKLCSSLPTRPAMVSSGVACAATNNDMDVAGDSDASDPALVFGTDISEEEAQAFISRLQARRDGVVTLRPSLCGALKHLGESLYASQLHFVDELLQNADDCRYNATVVPTLCVQATNSHINFHHNEVGLSPRDVLSLCSLAVSTKKRGVDLGHKGIGFKAVFACSHRPVLMSGAFRFSFQAPGPESDELSFITPRWLHEVPSALNGTLSADGTGTNIFLPFRPELQADGNYAHKLCKAFDPLVLLSLRRLRRLEVNGLTSFVEKGSAASFSCGNRTSSFWHSTLTSGETRRKFAVFSVEIPVPRAMAEGADRSSVTSTTVLMAFPEEPDGLPLPVCAGLPVCEAARFPFLLNADWELTTSREAVREGSAWNLHLRCAAAAFFADIGVHGSVRPRLAAYLPTASNECSSFWQAFVDEAMEALHRRLPGLLAMAPGTEPRLPCPEAARLVDSAALTRCAQLQVVEDPAMAAMLERCGVKAVDALDVLRCLEVEPNLCHQDDDYDWWQVLFDYFMTCASHHTFLERAKAAPLFQVKTSNSRTVPGRRPFPIETLVSFVDSPLQPWRHELAFLECASDSERKFLLASGLAKIWSAKSCAAGILALHLEQRSFPQTAHTVSTLWHDLAFLRSLPWLELEMACSSHFGCSAVPGDAALVPTQAGIRPASHASLPTVLTMLVPAVPSTEGKPAAQVALPYGAEADQGDVADAISWEQFLLRLGCSPASLAVDGLSESAARGDPQVLPPLASLGDPVVATDVVAAQRPQVLAWLQTCVCALAVSGRLVPLGGLLSEAAFRGLPAMPDGVEVLAVPFEGETLAEQLGVHMRPGIDACLMALRALADWHVCRVGPYVELLSRLQALSAMQGGKLVPGIALDSSIYLPQGISERADFVRISDVYVCGVDELYGAGREELRLAMWKLCKYLRRGLVDQATNTAYLSFSEELLELGAQRRPRASDCALSICVASCDARNFHRAGAGQASRLLNEDGRQTLLGLFHLYEWALQCEDGPDSGDPGVWLDGSSVRQAVEAFTGRDALAIWPENGRCALPLITWDERVVRGDGRSLWACRSPWLMDAAISTGAPLTFVHTELASRCPRLVAELGLEDMEARSIIRWTHRNNNAEQELQEVSEAFRREVGDSSLIVLSGAWIALYLIFSLAERLDVKSLTAEAMERPGVIQVQLRMQPPFAVVGSHVVLALKFVQEPAARAALAAAALAQLLQHRCSVDRDKAEASARSTCEHLRNLSSLRFWEGAQTPEHFFAASAVLLPSSSQEALGLRGLVGSFGGVERYEDEATDVIRGRWRGAGGPHSVPGMHAGCFGGESAAQLVDRRRDDELFQILAQRLLESGTAGSEPQMTNVLAPGLLSALDVATLKEQQQMIGQRAEHFYSRYLEALYGDDYQPTRDWLSSTRCLLFPEARSGVDDAAGCDFIVLDTLQHFVRGGRRTARCFIEVKGLSGPFAGAVCVSANEKRKRDEVAARQGEGDAYILAIVDNLVDPDRCSVRHFNWGTNSALIALEPESFIARLVPEQLKGTAAEGAGSENVPVGTVEESRRYKSQRPERFGAAPVATSSTAEVCKFFSNSGRCRWGDACYYSHTLASVAKEETSSCTVNIPQHLLGKLIGSKGATIRWIESETGASIITGKEKAPAPQLAAVRLSGSAQAVQQAKARIREVIHAAN